MTAVPPDVPDIQTSEGSVVLFDGVCNFCEGSVQFIIKRDPKGTFRFASLQSTPGERIAKAFGIDTSRAHSVLLIENGRAFDESEAALRIAGKLRFPWNLLSVFRIVPAVLRDPCYRLIARNRYKWFGKKDECMVPGPDIRARFLS